MKQYSCFIDTTTAMYHFVRLTTQKTRLSYYFVTNVPTFYKTYLKKLRS